MTGARTERAERRLPDAYAAALHAYLAGGGEDALRSGYELGRRAMADGVGVMELALVHHDALAAVLRARGSARLELDLRRAKQFAAESLSPYEMAHRGFADAMSALRRLNETLEKEIRRIASAVHDEAGQLLFAARLALTELSRDVGPALQERVGEIGAILDGAEKELRLLSHELRPAGLDEQGLLPALRRLADGTVRRAGLSVRVEGLVEERLPPGIEATLYRVVQEALTNVTKHSEASEVRIRVTRNAPGAIRCVVADDGKGFDAPAVLRGDAPRGLGLVGVRERLDAVGGALLIRSAPGRGTEVVVTIPMED